MRASDMSAYLPEAGADGGEQQFTAAAIQLVNCKTAVQFIWDWGWVRRLISATQKL